MWNLKTFCIFHRSVRWAKLIKKFWQFKIILTFNLLSLFLSIRSGGSISLNKVFNKLFYFKSDYTRGHLKERAIFSKHCSIYKSCFEWKTYFIFCIAVDTRFHIEENQLKKKMQVRNMDNSPVCKILKKIFLQTANKWQSTALESKTCKTYVSYANKNMYRLCYVCIMSFKGNVFH